MSGIRLAVNVVVFQAAWLGAVGGAGAGLMWLGPAAALVAVVSHLWLVKQPRRELCAIACVAMLGTAWDVAGAALGLVEYRGGEVALAGAPLWIVALWLAFATTLNTSLRWLRERPEIALGLGLVAGPLAYAAGERLGAIKLVEPVTSLGAQAVGWALLLPLSVRVASHFDGPEGPARV